MKYGCIGEVLKHSFSSQIHNALGYDYKLVELKRDEVGPFMEEADFLAINVTIPYKETVIPYLDEIDEAARLIGAVNTVVKRDGKLFGYNTDFFGLSALALRIGIDFKDKKVLILGTGGTSKTSYAVAKHFGAREIVRASRDGKESAVLYSDVYKYHTDADIIINTTPVGMYPKCDACPIDIDRFPSLSGVIDAIYNPNETKLIRAAKRRGIPAEGGLYMLVAQAVLASEHFRGFKFDESVLDDVFEDIRRRNKNIVLIGMPASGKSTVGGLIADKLGRRFIDTDALIVSACGIDIPEIFSRFGEEYFRDRESEAVANAARETGVVIATGGGAILREENLEALRQNGTLYFIDRPLSALIPTDDRPLSSTKEAIEKRYRERYSIYSSACDVIIEANCDADSVCERILSDFFK